ncbi:ubiquitin-protein ligase peroxin 2 KNAG_0E00110 [Huiozyma naganishii CBS 8797]|uniref:RING-type E3 ubiquitin transferase (cysteine targeting) n=1 Tax=Huiozyma naganishii (strain ATCC MYA-139 / BCRC 22969 / CBS 8797 / KCTC 17520 / NBRC 10181 / NCYC 3082 / Yp74L-3) TaxID=1071383 RepID=J7S6A1_HUIN7|nr:hypothetical protein KNAG_0E00110 [Kazachstania naganishii CBS 8797]CCK70279.1 hypothetical protein KNAG_0E00110 [Kazachstania naganishii CBS 8797]
MLRVAHLDSNALDNELGAFFWANFKALLPLVNGEYVEEWKLALDTLVFLFATKYSRIFRCSTTYGSRLSNLSFKCGRIALFVVTVFQSYLSKKLSHRIFNRDSGRNVKFYRVMLALYNVFDACNFCHFLSNWGNEYGENKVYYTLLQRLLDVRPARIRGEQSYYQSMIYSGLEYQNRQLLWNSVLELLNITVLPRAISRLTSKRRGKPVLERETDIEHCHLCGEFPTMPYRIFCCERLYCYVCFLKVLELRECQNCHNKQEIKGMPYYG